VVINFDDFIGCGICIDIFSDVFGFNESETKAFVNNRAVANEECIEQENELSPAATCGVSGHYDIVNLIEASFGELDPKRLNHVPLSVFHGYLTSVRVARHA
jgi:hypothetical protein